LYHASTIHQPVHVPVTMYHSKCINHAENVSPILPHHVQTIHINHVHQHHTNLAKICLKNYANIKCPTCTSIMFQRKNQAMPQHVLKQQSHQPYNMATMYLKHLLYHSWYASKNYHKPYVNVSNTYTSNVSQQVDLNQHASCIQWFPLVI
jgi:hypothetical protein